MTTNRSVTVDSLEKNKAYPVHKAERVQSRYGVSILLTVKDSYVNAVRVYLRKRYTDVFTDVDIDVINNGTLKFK